MKERIIEFLRAENKSSAQFAEEIGVQPSGISHIVSGRNNPSLDFVVKMLDRYKYLSTDWLLFGKGSMYKDNSTMPSLFEQTLFDQKPINEEKPKESFKEPVEIASNEKHAEKTGKVSWPEEVNQERANPDKKGNVEKIVWFYADGSFEEYYPRK